MNGEEAPKGDGVEEKAALGCPNPGFVWVVAGGWPVEGWPEGFPNTEAVDWVVLGANIELD